MVQTFHGHHSLQRTKLHITPLFMIPVKISCSKILALLHTSVTLSNQSMSNFENYRVNFRAFGLRGRITPTMRNRRHVGGRILFRIIFIPIIMAF